jgi:hypothetical protein
MPLLQSLLGQRFGDLTVLERARKNSRANRVRWICSCACGNKVVVAGCHLVSGHTRSCGCLRKQVTGARVFKNRIGQRFGRLVVLQEAGRNKHGQVIWLCVCDCGNKTVVSGGLLACGNTRSCGCLHREVVSKSNSTHGMSKTRIYRIYHGAKRRCTDPNHKNFAGYGGRGIEFRYPSFEEFFAERGLPPEGMTLERIDNDGHYEPGNCKWATRREQANNKRKYRKRSNRISIASRRTQTVAEWATEFNVPLNAVQALQARIRASQGAAP